MDKIDSKKNKYSGHYKPLNKYGRLHYLEMLSNGDPTSYEDTKIIDLDTFTKLLMYRKETEKINDLVRELMKHDSKRN